MDYTIVPANVDKGTVNVLTKQGIAGAGVTAGQAVYLDASDGKLKLADSNSGTVGARTVEGFALHGSLNGQPLVYVYTSDDYAPGFAIAAGEAVILSENPGNLAPYSDAATGDFITFCLLGVGSNKAKIARVASTVAKP